MDLFIPVPKKTNECVVRNNQIVKFSNLFLLFNKYVMWRRDNSKVEKDKKALENILKSFDLDLGKQYLESFVNRMSKVLDEFGSQGYHVSKFELITDYRLVIGLGSAHVLETGFILHPLYGFPYIPASSVKGIARAYAEFSKGLGKDEIVEIFGSESKDDVTKTNREGKAIFLDGVPQKFPTLELDIMNPHYAEYYQGNKPPADYLMPTPITFLTVAPGEKFLFFVISREKEIFEKASDCLINGLIECGVGGKTNLGYGIFKKSGVSNAGGQVNSATDKISDLVKMLSAIKGAGDKERLSKVLDEADKNLNNEEKKEFLKRLKEVVKKDVLKNDKIKPIIKNFEDKVK